MDPVNSVLDNPIWNALSTRQNHFAVGEGQAHRFDSEIGPLAGLSEQSPEAYADLSRLLTQDEPAVLFLEHEPQLPEGWGLMRHEPLTQMVCPEAPKALPIKTESAAKWELQTLSVGNIPEMLDLVRLTEPGPFCKRTIELGGYLGIRQDGRLAAMSGQRLAPPGFTEVSAVCTHPDFRGHGYAQLLVATVAQRIRERGEIPFLTLLASNTAAERVYESVGFERRRHLHLAVVTRPSQQT